jgi:hypothetical protein
MNYCAGYDGIQKHEPVDSLNWEAYNGSYKVCDCRRIEKWLWTCARTWKIMMENYGIGNGKGVHSAYRHKVQWK